MTPEDDLNWPPSDSQADLLEIYELRDDGLVGIGHGHASRHVPPERTSAAPVSARPRLDLSGRARRYVTLAVAAGTILVFSSDYQPGRVLSSAPSPTVARTAVELQPARDVGGQTNLTTPTDPPRPPGRAVREARRRAPARAVPAPARASTPAAALAPWAHAATTGPQPIHEVLPTRVPRPFPSPGARARVIVSIDERGRVRSARVVDATVGYLEAPLLRAAREWRYEPARRDGVAVASRRTVDFVLP